MPTNLPKLRDFSVPDWITAICTFVIAATGICTLVFAIVQIHELKEEARVQHLLERLQEFDGPRLSAVRKALAAKRIDETQNRLRPLDVDDPPGEMEDELNFCDDLGLLTKRGALDRHDVWNEFAYWLFPLYADARPLIDSDQKDSPATYRECSDLLESIKPIEKQEDAGADDHPSETDIYAFYLGEIDNQLKEPIHQQGGVGNRSYL